MPMLVLWAVVFLSLINKIQNQDYCAEPDGSVANLLEFYVPFKENPCYLCLCVHNQLRVHMDTFCTNITCTDHLILVDSTYAKINCCRNYTTPSTKIGLYDMPELFKRIGAAISVLFIFIVMIVFIKRFVINGSNGSDRVCHLSAESNPGIELHEISPPPYVDPKLVPSEKNAPTEESFTIYDDTALPPSYSQILSINTEKLEKK